MLLFLTVECWRNKHEKLVNEVWHGEYEAANKADFHNSANHLRHFYIDEIDIPGGQNQEVEYWFEEYEGNDCGNYYCDYTFN